MKQLTRLTCIFDGIIGGAAHVASILLAIIIICVLYEVVMRYFLNSPTIWVVQITEIGPLYITFLTAAWLLKRDKHVKMDLLLNSLNSRTQALLNAITSVIGTLTCLVVVWFGVLITWEHFQTGQYRPAIIDIPNAIILGVIPFGCLLLSIQFVRRSYNYFIIWRSQEK